MYRRLLLTMILVVLAGGLGASNLATRVHTPAVQASSLHDNPTPVAGCVPQTPTPGPTPAPGADVLIATGGVDPNMLRLPDGSLPPQTHIDHQGISDNPDADGRTVPPDCVVAQMHVAHQHFYEQLNRISGYRMDLRYTVQGTDVGTEYMASIFASAADATAAMNDAIGPTSIIGYLGQPLPQPCTAGDVCKSFSGPNPGTPNKVVLGIFTRGRILIETASQVPAASFDQFEPVMQQTLYGLLNAADAQAQLALSGPAKPTATAATADTPTPTSTATATDTPVPPTDTPTPKPAPKHKKCKKGYKLVKGKCKKVKKK